MKPINIRKPGIQVTLYKNIARKTTSGTTPVSARYAGQSSVVDLTPYLSESNPVRVSKSVRAPAGTFSVALADKIDTDVLDSLYSVIEPMDSIVIRISAWSTTTDGVNMPVMMRGFVSQVQRMEGMSAAGKPERHVVITGHDYGKILQMMQIFFMPNAPEDAAAMITSFPFFAKFGDFSNVMEAGAFTQTLFDKVVNPYINQMGGRTDDAAARAAAAARNKQYLAIVAQMSANNDKRGDLNTQASRAAAAGDSSSATTYLSPSSALGKQTQALYEQAKALKAQGLSYQASSAILNINTDIQVTGAQVSPFGVGTFSGGNIHSLIRSYGDIGAWNEFFIEDREDGVYAVYRPNPFKDPVTGNFLLSGVTAPTIVDIDRSHIVSTTMSRSDANVANYFWADCPRFLLNYESTARMLAYGAAQDSAPFYVTDYGNVDPSLYGVRKLEETTQQAGLGESDNGNGTQAGPPRNASMNGALTWINSRRQQLFDQNKDNVVLESGSMRLKGRESIKAGRYLRLTHGTMQSDYYIVGVTHDFTPFGSYFTEVQFERGTGFVDRIQKVAGEQAPYYSEMVTKQ